MLYYAYIFLENRNNGQKEILPCAASIVAKQLATAGFGAHANAGVSPSASTAMTLAPNCNSRRVIWKK